MTKYWERIILQGTKNEELRMKNRNKNNDMKKGFQWMVLLVVAMLGACSGGSDKAAAEKVDEKPKVKLAEVSVPSRRTDSGIHRYGGSRSRKTILLPLLRCV